MRALTVPQSGKQGTTVAVLTRYGQVMRQYIKPKDPHSQAQMRIRSNLSRVSDGAAPCSAGISFVRDFTMLGPLPDPQRGISDITDIHVARYGVPRAGSQVFLRTRQQINGWEDAPKQVSAIVPKA